MSGLAEEDIGRSRGALWLRRGAGTVLAAALVAGLVILGQNLGKSTGRPPRQVAKIRLVPDTPPPPRPKEERKPEPPKEAPKEVQVEQPKEQTPEPAPTEQLKMEGPGSDNGLAGVAAGTVRNDYIGQPLGADGSRFAWYGGQVQQQIQQALSRNPKLRGGEYKVVLRVWVSPEGAISRAELEGSTGSRDTDSLIRTALVELPPLRERPPEGMPQPVKLRVTSRL